MKHWVSVGTGCVCNAIVVRVQDLAVQKYRSGSIRQV